MPAKPLKVCSWEGCKTHTRTKYCERHHDAGTGKEQEARKAAMKRSDAARGSASKRGYNARWRRASKQFLNRNPMCKRCTDKGDYSPAQVVDHTRPHKGDYSMFWDESNWQPLCKPCHDTKTATEDR